MSLTQTDTRADTRTTSYHWWSRLIAILLALLLVLLWWLGSGPHNAKCCDGTDATPAPASAPAAIAPVAAPAPAASMPAVEASAPAAITAAAAPAAPVVQTPKEALAPMPASDDCDGKLKAAVGFETGSKLLSASGRKALDGMISCLKLKKASIVGHTDNVGQAASNLALSEARARAVAQYLLQKGVPEGNLTAKGMGDQDPIADNKTAEGRAQNRRMTIAPQ